MIGMRRGARALHRSWATALWLAIAPLPAWARDPAPASGPVQAQGLAEAQPQPGPTPDPGPVTPEPGAPPAPPQRWAIHEQATLTVQGAPGFSAAYTGANSLHPGGETRETVDVTLLAGLHLWRGAEVWLNPEVDQGFGLADTLGFAGFPSGEAYKVGAVDPYIRLQRFFLRQTFDLGGETQPVAPDLNVLGGSQTANRLVLWAGKMSVGDVFDANRYAHDPARRLPQLDHHRHRHVRLRR